MDPFFETRMRYLNACYRFFWIYRTLERMRCRLIEHGVGMRIEMGR